MCTGASLGGGRSPPAVPVLPGQVRSRPRRRKRVPNRRYKNSRRRRRRRVPNRRHKNGKAPGERVFCRERVQQGSGPLQHSCAPLQRPCAPAAAALTREKRHRRSRRVTISIGPPLECGCVGECGRVQEQPGRSVPFELRGLQETSWPYSTGTERASASSNCQAGCEGTCSNRLREQTVRQLSGGPTYPPQHTEDRGIDPLACTTSLFDGLFKFIKYVRTHHMSALAHLRAVQPRRATLIDRSIPRAELARTSRRLGNAERRAGSL